MAINLNSLLKRTVSGIVLLVVTVALLLISPYTMLVFLELITGFSLWEFYKLQESETLHPLRQYGIGLGLLWVGLNGAVAFGTVEPRYLALFLPLLFGVFIAELYRKRPNPFGNITTTLGGLLYIALPMSLLCYLPMHTTPTQTEYLPFILLAYVGIVWVNDVGAYLVGITLGHYKFFPRISPKKSWEGFFGGFIFAIAAGCSIGNYLPGGMLGWGIAGAIISLSGVAGDLVESLLKRSLSVKDSADTIPGHGGFLDRFDAMFLSAPFVFAYFILADPLN